MANTSKAKDKVENPEAHFAKPKEVVKDNVLSHDEKKNALNLIYLILEWMGCCRHRILA